MILTVVVILVVLWLLGFTVVHIGGLIHLVLLVALAVFLYDYFVKKRR